jgi:uncharacterized protein (DUF1015 family)
VAIIKPFRALRPNHDKAKLVSCFPYDVVYDGEVRQFIEENPISFLRVTRPEAEFPEETNPSIEQIFAKAKENLEWFIKEEYLPLKPTRAFTFTGLKPKRTRKPVSSPAVL